jgi:HK97 family phage portal protein
MGRIATFLDSFTRSNPAAAAATRSFVTGPAVIDRSQSQFKWLGEDKWSPAEYGEYVALSNAVYAAVKMRYTLVSSLPLKFYTGKGDARKEVTSGPVVDLFASVNPFWTFDRLMQMTEQSLCLWGKCFWFIERGGTSGVPKQLWWARPDQVRVVSSAANYIDHFILDARNGNDPIRFETDETFWLRTPNPIDEFEGLSPVAAVRISADTAVSAMQSNYNIFKNGIQAGGFFSPKAGGPTLTKEQADELNDQMNRRFKGVDKAHRWGTFAFPVDITTIAMSPKDAEFLGALNWSLEEVCRAFGVPIDLIGGQRTYANVDASERIIWTHAIRPEADFIAAEITEQILPMFNVPGLVAEFDYSDVEVLREAESDAWSRESDQIIRGVLLPNEWRKKKGMPPVPWGDVWWARWGSCPCATTATRPRPRSSPRRSPTPCRPDPDRTSIPTSPSPRTNPSTTARRKRWHRARRPHAAARAPRWPTAHPSTARPSSASSAARRSTRPPSPR